MKYSIWYSIPGVTEIEANTPEEAQIKFNELMKRNRNVLLSGLSLDTADIHSMDDENGVVFE